MYAGCPLVLGAAAASSAPDAWAAAAASASNRKSILRASRYSFQQPTPSSPTPTTTTKQAPFTAQTQAGASARAELPTAPTRATANGDTSTRAVGELVPATANPPASRALDTSTPTPTPTSLPAEQVCFVDLPIRYTTYVV